MRLLISSVRRPYAFDDALGSNKYGMARYRDEVTWEQHIFSCRVHHHGFGLDSKAANADAPIRTFE